MSDTQTKLFDMAQNLRDTGNRLSEDGWISTGNAIVDYCKTIDEAARELAETKRENESLRKDAERYRYFKKHLHQPHAIQHFVAFNNWNPSDADKLKDLDSAIDAAIKE